jgi:hypothetical protein
LNSVFDPKFYQQVAHMSLYGWDGNEQGFGDLVVASTLRDMQQNVMFTFRERVKYRWRIRL